MNVIVKSTYALLFSNTHFRNISDNPLNPKTNTQEGALRALEQNSADGSILLKKV